MAILIFRPSTPRSVLCGDISEQNAAQVKDGGETFQPHFVFCG